MARLHTSSLCFLAFLLMAISTQAEKPINPSITPEMLEAFKPKVHSNENAKLPYRLLSPLQVEAEATYPLVLFLHGMGERGTDNQRQLIHGGSVMANKSFRKKHPAFIVAPQCPDGIEPGLMIDGKEVQRVWTWRLALDTSSEIALDKSPSPQLASVQSLVAKLMQTLPIDPDRVYVTGLSMGGYGTWEIATRNPNLFAAAAPVCGGGDPNHAGKLANLPLWAFHGAIDSVVPTARSREMIEAIEAVGGRPIYTEYEETNHDSWTATYNSQHVWDWLFAQKR